MEALVLVGILLARAPLQAEVVKTATGTVEFVGLEDWTPEKIRAALGYKSSEELHYCAADLKNIGFPDSNVTPYREAGSRYTVVTLVEPKYATQLAFHAAPDGTDAVPQTWRGLVTLARDPPVFLQGAFLDYAATAAGKQKLASDEPAWWAVLRARATEPDYRKAITLIGHKDPQTRAAAAMALVHFGSREPAWWALMHALRDPDETVRSTAMQTLISLWTYAPRHVDWSQSRESIAAVLRGTNLPALSHVLIILPKTGLSPSLGRKLLKRDERRMVLALLRARHDRERDLAYRFLVTATGQDFGFDAQRWENWFQH